MMRWTCTSFELFSVVFLLQACSVLADSQCEAGQPSAQGAESCLEDDPSRGAALMQIKALKPSVVVIPADELQRTWIPDHLLKPTKQDHDGQTLSFTWQESKPRTGLYTSQSIPLTSVKDNDGAEGLFSDTVVRSPPGHHSSAKIPSGYPHHGHPHGAVGAADDQHGHPHGAVDMGGADVQHGHPHGAVDPAEDKHDHPHGAVGGAENNDNSDEESDTQSGGSGDNFADDDNDDDDEPNEPDDNDNDDHGKHNHDHHHDHDAQSDFDLYSGGDDCISWEDAKTHLETSLQDNVNIDLPPPTPDEKKAVLEEMKMSFEHTDQNGDGCIDRAEFEITHGGPMEQSPEAQSSASVGDHDYAKEAARAAREAAEVAQKAADMAQHAKEKEKSLPHAHGDHRRDTSDVGPKAAEAAWEAARAAEKIEKQGEKAAAQSGDPVDHEDFEHNFPDNFPDVHNNGRSGKGSKDSGDNFPDNNFPNDFPNNFPNDFPDNSPANAPHIHHNHNNEDEHGGSGSGNKHKRSRSEENVDDNNDDDHPDGPPEIHNHFPSNQDDQIQSHVRQQNPQPPPGPEEEYMKKRMGHRKE